MKRNMLATILFCLCLTTTIYASSKTYSLIDGPVVSLNQGSISYATFAQPGDIEFYCELQGSDAGNDILAIVVTPGKNFDNGQNVARFMTKDNPKQKFTWALRNQEFKPANENLEGDVNVTLSGGKGVKVQCKGYGVISKH